MNNYQDELDLTSSIEANEIESLMSTMFFTANMNEKTNLTVNSIYFQTINNYENINAINKNNKEKDEFKSLNFDDEKILKCVKNNNLNEVIELKITLTNEFTLFLNDMNSFFMTLGKQNIYYKIDKNLLILSGEKNKIECIAQYLQKFFKGMEIQKLSYSKKQIQAIIFYYSTSPKNGYYLTSYNNVNNKIDLLIYFYKDFDISKRKDMILFIKSYNFYLFDLFFSEEKYNKLIVSNEKSETIFICQLALKCLLTNENSIYRKFVYSKDEKFNSVCFYYPKTDIFNEEEIFFIKMKEKIKKEKIFFSFTLKLNELNENYEYLINFFIYISNIKDEDFISSIVYSQKGELILNFFIKKEKFQLKFLRKTANTFFKNCSKSKIIELKNELSNIIATKLIVLKSSFQKTTDLLFNLSFFENYFREEIKEERIILKRKSILEEFFEMNFIENEYLVQVWKFISDFINLSRPNL